MNPEPAALYLKTKPIKPVLFTSNPSDSPMEGGRDYLLESLPPSAVSLSESLAPTKTRVLALALLPAKMASKT